MAGAPRGSRRCGHNPPKAFPLQDAGFDMRCGMNSEVQNREQPQAAVLSRNGAKEAAGWRRSKRPLCRLGERPPSRALGHPPAGPGQESGEDGTRGQRAGTGAHAHAGGSSNHRAQSPRYATGRYACPPRAPLTSWRHCSRSSGGSPWTGRGDRRRRHPRRLPPPRTHPPPATPIQSCPPLICIQRSGRTRACCGRC